VISNSEKKVSSKLEEIYWLNTIKKHLFQASHLVAYNFEKMPPGFFFPFHHIHTIFFFYGNPHLWKKHLLNQLTQSLF
jgi:hypothetical protein